MLLRIFEGVAKHSEAHTLHLLTAGLGATLFRVFEWRLRVRGK